MIDAVNSPYIHAADTDNFQAMVLDNSRKGPVLVNFWSRKAGPCLRLYPVLDQLVHHYGGRLLLVNIDTETEFVYTREYAVTSVPLLKLFRNGRVMETWRGYQSREDLTRVLDLYVARESDAFLTRAIAAYGEGRAAEAFDILAKAIVDDPANPRLPAAVCKLLRHEQRFDEAVQLIESLPAPMQETAEFIRLLESLRFCREADPGQNIDGLRGRLEDSPGDLDALRQLVAHYVMQQQYEPALEQLAAAMYADKESREKYLQQTMLRIFRILGDDEPMITKYRGLLRRYTH